VGGIFLKNRSCVNSMIRGSELRNLFNVHMRKLYSAKDNSGNSVTGRSGSLKFKSVKYIDLYFDDCYKVIDKYNIEEELKSKEIIQFIKELKSCTSDFISKDIKSDTVLLVKKYLIEYINSFKGKYPNSAQIEINKIIFDIRMDDGHTSITSFNIDDNDEDSKFSQKKKDKVVESVEEEKENIYGDDSSGLNFDKGYESHNMPSSNYENIKNSYIKDRHNSTKAKGLNKLFKKDTDKESNQKINQDNNDKDKKYNRKAGKATYKNNSKYSNDYENIKSSNSWKNTNTKIDRDKLEEVVDAKHSFKVGRIIIIAIVLCALTFGFYYFANLDSQPIALNNTNASLEDVVEEQVLEKPPVPILEEFKLSEIEKEIINGINEKRVDYSRSKYEVNMELSEINSEYLRIAKLKGLTAADEEIGDLGERSKKVNLKSNLIEVNFEFDNSLSIDQIVSNMRHSNLYLDEYNGIALSVFEADSKYFILMNIYKNG
jgi:hypothetical protein